MAEDVTLGVLVALAVVVGVCVAVGSDVTVGVGLGARFSLSPGTKMLTFSTPSNPGELVNALELTGPSALSISKLIRAPFSGAP